MSFSNMMDQAYPPKATFSEGDVPSQAGRVFVVTGGNVGVGYELCKMLYGTGATIYIASRSKEKVEKAIEAIKAEAPATASKGTLKPLLIDLADLTSVKAAAASFNEQESRLDVLWNNAGIGSRLVKPDTKTKQGIPILVGTNCVGPLLLTELVLPRLRAAAAAPIPGVAASSAPRVVWAASYLSEGGTPPNGLDFASLATGSGNTDTDYGVSKLGNWFLGREFARRHGGGLGENKDANAAAGNDVIISVVQNPGNLRTNVWGGVPRLAMVLLNSLMLKPARFGGLTELYAGLSPEIGPAQNGTYVKPWGRLYRLEDVPRKDLVRAMTPEEEGGLGYDTKFWEWCHERIAEYL